MPDPTTMPEGSALREAYEAVVKAEKARHESPAPEPSPSPSQSAGDIPAELKSFWGEKHDDGRWEWAGGARSFEELEAFREAQAVEQAVNDVFWNFQMLTENVMGDAELSGSQKATQVAALAAEAQPRIAEAEAAAAEDFRAASEEAEAESDDLKAIDRGSVTVFKDLDDELRWLALHSNHYRDREREIFSGKAHQEYADWAMSEKGTLPTLRLWHAPVDVGDADMVGFDGSFMISTGTFRKEYQQLAVNLKDSDEALGCSHGFQYRPQDLRDGVYDRYRSFEVSVLPVNAAANAYTAFIAEGDLPMLSDTQKDFIASKGGPELVAKVEAASASLTKAADDAGVDYKSMVDLLFAEKDDETPPVETPPVAETPPAPETPAVTEIPAPAAVAPVTPPVAETPPTPPAPAPVVDDGKALAELVTTAVKAAIEPLEAEVAELKAKDATLDERVAAAIAPGTKDYVAVSHSRTGAEVADDVAAAMKEKAEGTEEKALDGPAADYMAMLYPARP